MNNETSFRTISAVSAMIAAVLILVSNIVLATAVDFNFDFLSNPGSMLIAGLDAGAIELFRWGSIIEMFGYCLFLIPLTLYLWFWFRSQGLSLITLATIFGLGSIFIGVIEETIRISFWPAMMIAYPQATEAQRQVLQVVFQSVTDFTFQGLYASESILLGLWWLGIGLVLFHERRILGIITTIMGIAALCAGLGWMLQIDPLARLETFYFFEPVWLIWLGIVIWRQNEQSEPGLQFEAIT